MNFETFVNIGAGGGGGGCKPSLRLFRRYIISEMFYLRKIACDVLYMNKVNILGFGTVGARDVIQNGHQYGRHLGFLHLKFCYF